MPDQINGFSWPLRVYIEDTDAGGIVYHANYLKFMERARTEYLRSLGFDKVFVFSPELMFIVSSINSQYLRPAKLDDELHVTVRVQKSGASYLLLEQLVYRHDELLCKGEVQIVCADRQSITPKRIPTSMRNALGL